MSLYITQPNNSIHRGAIYRFLPVSWLRNPLWVVREIRWTQPRSAGIHRDSELTNSFKLSANNNEEDVLAIAKKRFIVVMSPNNGINNLKEILVAPIYTLDGKQKSPDLITNIKSTPDHFYLEYDSIYSDIKESFIDFKQIRPLHRDFFSNESKLKFSFDTIAMEAILNRFMDYISS